MDQQSSIRSFVVENLPTLVGEVNKVLLGGSFLHRAKKHIAAVSCGGKLPPWFGPLATGKGLPANGKSIGSVLETIFAAVLRANIPNDLGEKVVVRSSRGVDIPAAGIGIKAPSANRCTSDPYCSPYQRLLGQPYDTVVLLTDYQVKKSTHPLILQVTRSAYYRGSQMADRGMCAVAKKWSHLLGGDLDQYRKLTRFLAYANQGDPSARRIVSRLRSVPLSPRARLRLVEEAHKWAEGWGYGGAHWPSAHEWSAILTSRLDGKTVMSDARQWRHKFSLNLD